LTGASIFPAKKMDCRVATRRLGDDAEMLRGDNA
jgi:hypothetical protein